MKIPANFSIFKNTKLRNAGRLFFAVKINIGHKVERAESLFAALDGFSKYEIDQGLKVLLSERWVSRGANGRLYFRGINFLGQKYMGGSRSFLSVNVEKWHIESKASWRAFLDGSSISLIIRRSSRNIEIKDRLRHTLAGNNAALSSTAMPLSCSYLGSTAGVSSVEAYRMRKRARDGGYIQLNSQWQDTGAKIHPSELAAFKEASRDRGDRRHYDIDCGSLVYQLPDFVTVLPGVVVRKNRQKCA